MTASIGSDNNLWLYYGTGNQQKIQRISNNIENRIYNSRTNKIEILEDKNYFIFYQIDKINTKLPNLNNDEFKT